MRAPSFLTLAAVVTLGAAVLGAQQKRVEPIRVTPQPLLGVGTNTATVAGPDAFFDDNVLQEIRLTMNARDWQTLKDNYLDNTYYPADFRWRDQIVRNIGIRSRGTGSRSGVKPGLRVDFDRYVGNQKFLTLKSFVLRNNTQDSTNMHERISMLLFRRLGEPAPRETHTRMYVNDVYAGLFTIVESIDKDFLKKTFGEDSGWLYKYDYPSDGTPYYFTDKGSSGSAYVPLPFKPETRETDPQGDTIAQWVQTVNAATPANFESMVSPFIDLQKFLRHVAVEVFLADYDGFIGNYGINNFYVYRFDNTRVFRLIAWDKSEAFKAGPDASILHNITGIPDSQRNRLFHGALGVTSLSNYFFNTLLECARSTSELVAGDARGWMEREVEKEYSQIRQAAREDTEKPYSNDDFEAAVNTLRDFATRRAGFVTTEATSQLR
jgi:spore coat protein CotH